MQKNKLAVLAGDLFKTDSAENGVLLRSSKVIRRLGQVFHQGSHPDYTKAVNDFMTARYNALKAAGQLTPENAAKSMYRLSGWLRGQVLNSRGSINNIFN